MIRYDKQARRLWILDRRVHHGMVGIVVMAFGSIAAWHDRRDWRDWIRFR